MEWNDYGYYPMQNSSLWFFAMLLMFLLFGVIIWVIIRTLGHSNQSRLHQEVKSTQSPSALEVLDMRLARGEISTEDYLLAKSHLKQ